ncbi:hypothetical protein CCUS01_10096 [Colletotrichum cuscutae]|uniref:Uncharacterized protein n=1 Tax=Colletotrichum cuscutae TaxID=1209917 RepID=A0AAI9UDG6_9PEZI|nr:hypothetical protein CCUS01_10096 [Colletotrichum cuscutae]
MNGGAPFSESSKDSISSPRGIARPSLHSPDSWSWLESKTGVHRGTLLAIVVFLLWRSFYRSHHVSRSWNETSARQYVKPPLFVSSVSLSIWHFCFSHPRGAEGKALLSPKNRLAAFALPLLCKYVRAVGIRTPYRVFIEALQLCKTILIDIKRRFLRSGSKSRQHVAFILGRGIDRFDEVHKQKKRTRRTHKAGISKSRYSADSRALATQLLAMAQPPSKRSLDGFIAKENRKLKPSHDWLRETSVRDIRLAMSRSLPDLSQLTVGDSVDSWACCKPQGMNGCTALLEFATMRGMLYLSFLGIDLPNTRNKISVETKDCGIRRTRGWSKIGSRGWESTSQGPSWIARMIGSTREKHEKRKQGTVELYLIEDLTLVRSIHPQLALGNATAHYMPTWQEQDGQSNEESWKERERKATMTIWAIRAVPPSQAHFKPTEILHLGDKTPPHTTDHPLRQIT